MADNTEINFQDPCQLNELIGQISFDNKQCLDLARPTMLDTLHRPSNGLVLDALVDPTPYVAVVRDP